MTIAIETKIIGLPDSEDEVYDLQIEDLPEYISLKDIIREKVRAEVKAYNANQKIGYGREYRSFEDLDKDIRKGEVNVKRVLVKDIEGEVSRAINAFNDGKYKVFFNGEQVNDLEEKIPTELDSTIMFVRLIPLTGG
jgi:hypothetical protein